MSQGFVCFFVFTSFDVMVSHLPEVQESLNWFLDFSQRELVQVLLNWCVCEGEEKSKAFYPAILLMSSPQN